MFFVTVAIIKILPRTFLILCDYLSDIVARNCLRVKIAKYLKKIQKWFPCLFLFMQEHGADLTATNNEGQTAMSLAVGIGNKNGKFTFIDFQWLSFGSFRTASKPTLPRKLWADLLRDLWPVIQGGKKQQRKFSLPRRQELAKLRASRLNSVGGGGGGGWAKFIECISWTLHKKGSS